MPFYACKGRLAWFGLQSQHIGLYVRPPVIDEHRAELSAYVTTKSAVHLPLDEGIPVGLVKKLIRAAMAHNEARSESRKQASRDSR